MTTTTTEPREICRYFSVTERALIRALEDGSRQIRRIDDDDWRDWRRKRADVPLETWRQQIRDRVARLPDWARTVTELPTLAELQEAMSDGVCATVSGDEIEPDGIGSDGAPSWLLALGFI